MSKEGRGMQKTATDLPMCLNTYFEGGVVHYNIHKSNLKTQKTYKHIQMGLLSLNKETNNSPYTWGGGWW